jgi:PKD repeat protein
LYIDNINIEEGIFNAWSEFEAYPAEGNAPHEVEFNDFSTGDISNWSWDFGDGNLSNEQNPVHTYNVPGTYSVSLSVSNNVITRSKSKTDYINVGNPIIIGEFGANSIYGKLPLEVSFNDLSSGEILSWLWDFGDGNTSTNQNPVHTYTDEGIYTVSLTINDLYSTVTETKTDYIRAEDFTADFIADTITGAVPLVINFNDLSTGNIDSWSWDFGDGNLSNEQNPVNTYTIPGTYSVSLSVSNQVLTDTETRTEYISVYEVYATTEEVSVCSGDDHTYPDGTAETGITANTSHISNLVSQVTGSDSIVTTNISVIEPIVTVSEIELCSGEDYIYPDGTTETNITANTSHISNLVSQVTGCDSIITSNIIVNPIDETYLSDTICLGESIQIGYAMFSQTGQYGVTLINHSGCDSLVYLDLYVNSVDVTVSKNENILTANNSTAEAYQWLDCDLELPINGETNNTFTVTESGDYAVAIEENNCVDTSSCNSIVISGIEDAESLVQAIWPNPTSGEINIRLTKNNSPVEISIYDVAGKLVLQKEVITKETEFVTELPGESGVYFVQIKSDTKVSTFKIIKK